MMENYVIFFCLQNLHVHIQQTQLNPIYMTITQYDLLFDGVSALQFLTQTLRLYHWLNKLLISYSKLFCFYDDRRYYSSENTWRLFLILRLTSFTVSDTLTSPNHHPTPTRSDIPIVPLPSSLPPAL